MNPEIKKILLEQAVNGGISRPWIEEKLKVDKTEVLSVGKLTTFLFNNITI